MPTEVPTPEIQSPPQTSHETLESKQSRIPNSEAAVGQIVTEIATSIASHYEEITTRRESDLAEAKKEESELSDKVKEAERLIETKNKISLRIDELEILQQNITLTISENRFTPGEKIISLLPEIIRPKKIKKKEEILEHARLQRKAADLEIDTLLEQKFQIVKDTYGSEATIVKDKANLQAAEQKLIDIQFESKEPIEIEEALSKEQRREHIRILDTAVESDKEDIKSEAEKIVSESELLTNSGKNYAIKLARERLIARVFEIDLISRNEIDPSLLTDEKISEDINSEEIMRSEGVERVAVATATRFLSDLYGIEAVTFINDKCQATTGLSLDLAYSPSLPRQVLDQSSFVYADVMNDEDYKESARLAGRLAIDSLKKLDIPQSVYDSSVAFLVQEVYSRSARSMVSSDSSGDIEFVNQLTKGVENADLVDTIHATINNQIDKTINAEGFWYAKQIWRSLDPELRHNLISKNPEKSTVHKLELSRILSSTEGRQVLSEEIDQITEIIKDDPSVIEINPDGVVNIKRELLNQLVVRDRLWTATSLYSLVSVESSLRLDMTSEDRKRWSYVINATKDFPDLVTEVNLGNIFELTIQNESNGEVVTYLDRRILMEKKPASSFTVFSSILKRDKDVKMAPEIFNRSQFSSEEWLCVSMIFGRESKLDIDMSEEKLAQLVTHIEKKQDYFEVDLDFLSQFPLPIWDKVFDSQGSVRLRQEDLELLISSPDQKDNRLAVIRQLFGNIADCPDPKFSQQSGGVKLIIDDEFQDYILGSDQGSWIIRKLSTEAVSQNIEVVSDKLNKLLSFIDKSKSISDQLPDSQRKIWIECTKGFLNKDILSNIDQIDTPDFFYTLLDSASQYHKGLMLSLLIEHKLATPDDNLVQLNKIISVLGNTRIDTKFVNDSLKLHDESQEGRLDYGIVPSKGVIKLKTSEILERAESSKFSYQLWLHRDKLKELGISIEIDDNDAGTSFENISRLYALIEKLPQYQSEEKPDFRILYEWLQDEKCPVKFDGANITISGNESVFWHSFMANGHIAKILYLPDQLSAMGIKVNLEIPRIIQYSDISWWENTVFKDVLYYRPNKIEELFTYNSETGEIKAKKAFIEKLIDTSSNSEYDKWIILKNKDMKWIDFPIHLEDEPVLQTLNIARKLRSTALETKNTTLRDFSLLLMSADLETAKALTDFITVENGIITIDQKILNSLSNLISNERERNNWLSAFSELSLGVDEVKLSFETPEAKDRFTKFAGVYLVSGGPRRDQLTYLKSRLGNMYFEDPLAADDFISSVFDITPSGIFANRKFFDHWISEFNKRKIDIYELKHYISESSKNGLVDLTNLSRFSQEERMLFSFDNDDIFKLLTVTVFDGTTSLDEAILKLDQYFDVGSVNVEGIGKKIPSLKAEVFLSLTKGGEAKYLNIALQNGMIEISSDQVDDKSFFSFLAIHQEWVSYYLTSVGEDVKKIHTQFNADFNAKTAEDGTIQFQITDRSFPQFYRYFGFNLINKIDDKGIFVELGPEYLQTYHVLKAIKHEPPIKNLVEYQNDLEIVSKRCAQYFTIIDEDTIELKPGQFYNFLNLIYHDSVHLSRYIESSSIRLNPESIKKELVERHFNSLENASLLEIDKQGWFSPEVIPSSLLEQSGFSQEFIFSQSNVFLSGEETAVDRKKMLKFLSFIRNSPHRARLVNIITQNPDIIINHDYQKYIVNSLDRIVQIPEAQFPEYMEVVSSITTSPSREIRRLGEELAQRIFSVDNPKEVYTKIEDVFVRNNTPLVGKIYQVFDILYPKEKLDVMLEKPNLSAVLRNAKTDLRRRDIIYRDLLKIHLESGNQSLFEYLKLIDSGSPLVDKFRAGETLTDEETRTLTNFTHKLQTLYKTSLMGRRSSPHPTEPGLSESIDQLYRDLRVKPGQTLDQRVCEMFLYPIGAKSTKEALDYMESSRQEAIDRIRQERQKYQGKYALMEGDLVKGIVTLEKLQNENGFLILGNILANGSVATEYLGSDSGHDSTPFDTDSVRLGATDIKDTFRKTFIGQQSSGYGDILQVVRDRGQFHDSANENSPVYAPDKLEIIPSKVVSENHTGVRTGWSAREVDLYIVKDNIKDDKRTLQNFFFAIAKQDIPSVVVDADGDEIFSEEMYYAYRKALQGIERFHGERIDVLYLEDNNPYRNLVDEYIPIIKNDRESVQIRNQEIRQKINIALKDIGVELKAEDDSSLLGAQLEDIGSTGRGTNLPGDFDFDYTLLLDPIAFKKAKEIKEILLGNIAHSGTIPGDGGNFSVQVRMTGVELSNGDSLDVDIGITSREDVEIFGSHKAVSEKIDSIALEYGEDTRNEVIANILVAKNLLKAGHAYKKADDGGIGGIGVENWILQHNGSIDSAFISFWEASHDENGGIVPIKEFRLKYPIFDAGSNLRQGKFHDNFSYTLTQEGYSSMIKVIEEYKLKKSGFFSPTPVQQTSSDV